MLAPILPSPSSSPADSPKPLLQAIAGVKPTRRPVWFMRQAGRSLPEYRRVREGIGMLDSCFMPELLAEITLQPVRRHDVDAAILFSDIVVPLKAAGVGVEIVAGRGPVMERACSSADECASVPILEGDIPELTEGIGLIRQGLTASQTLIGFAGAPFTLASYLVEGGPSKNHEKTKTMMHANPHAWHTLMQRLTPTIIRFLEIQIAAGVEVVQLFDSWVGFITERDYREHVLPYSTQILDAVAQLGVPRIHFGVGTGELLGAMSEAGSEVMGVDWRVPLDVAATRMVTPRVLQGNLDPALLFAGESVVRDEVARICAEADRACASGDALGHIFNLGHGVLPHTDPDAITRAVECVHQH
ncbi:uroporphyrinogen decarboxylase [Corynebacterium felinum]|uniref:Uroporphyrinogen decarboxylase n=1 Tax=Corynebacterium felinum TaxID=131318 RepID=A0ABU2B9Y4_9CORY|nr:uroporphyrinogen decarboxylase [Corynebacterium felinum]MDF5819960.1 uroporphyrinogen decarboxylase [Corynebacterium felinum]MDR7354553.1 uroporphyrinogen decarboxylase [Corynebacterium felinum]WJY93920.1 Uroporphyrinogen decarboxylase [Corynebacterium felinum]